MAGFAETFSGTRLDDQTWTFELDERFNGAFGGTNGGVLSAISIHAACDLSGRRPAGIDSRYLRGFRPGTARVVATAISQGRTLTVMGVDIVDADNRVCSHSVITLVEPSALAADVPRVSHLAPPGDLVSREDGKRWKAPAGAIPLIETFEPTALGGQGFETVTATRVLWRESATAAQASCIAADISVGPPVARAVRGAASTPNPDLSLRFCGSADPGGYLIAACELQTIEAGLATTKIVVWSDNNLLAIGISSTTCLPLKR